MSCFKQWIGLRRWWATLIGSSLCRRHFVVCRICRAGSAEQLGYMLDKLVTSLGKVSLKLNAAKTKVLTTQAQPPKTLTTRAGLKIGVLNRRPINGWAVCCPRLTQANGRMILTTDYKVRPVHFMFTNGFFATKWSQWHLI